MSSNLPPGLSGRDLDHIYGSAREPVCMCAHTLEEHEEEGSMACEVPDCDCSAWEEDLEWPY